MKELRKIVSILLTIMVLFTVGINKEANAAKKFPHKLKR